MTHEKYQMYIKKNVVLVEIFPALISHFHCFKGIIVSSNILYQALLLFNAVKFTFIIAYLILYLVFIQRSSDYL